jgi:hypothetical protein
MIDSPTPARWTRHLVHRTERTRTTWKFRIGVVILIGLVVWLSRDWWTVAVATSLVCEANGAPSDAILVENFDPDYLVFERARNLRREGLASRVLVPVHMDGDGAPNDVAVGIAEVMARISRLGPMEIVPIRNVEPYTLNAARDLLAYLQREQIRSVTIVAPPFRSRRSLLVYDSTFGPAGIAVRCVPARGGYTVDDWSQAWHGIQVVVEQWSKLQYYRFWVLPRAG